MNGKKNQKYSEMETWNNFKSLNKKIFNFSIETFNYIFQEFIKFQKTTINWNLIVYDLNFFFDFQNLIAATKKFLSILSASHYLFKKLKWFSL